MIERLERALRAAAEEVEGWRQFLEQRKAQAARAAEVGGEVSNAMSVADATNPDSREIRLYDTGHGTQRHRYVDLEDGLPPMEMPGDPPMPKPAPRSGVMDLFSTRHRLDQE